ncbi:hypothetical protein BH24DEI1_BH24DEI1_11080 [soil metagenome]
MDNALTDLTLRSFGEVVRAVLRLDPRVFEAVQAGPSGFPLAFLVVFLAGLSAALGQSVGLFVSGVRPARFALSLLLASLFFVTGFAFLTLSIWFISDYLFDRRGSLGEIARAVGLGYAPRLYGFFMLTPYFGSVIAVLLAVWSLMAVILGVSLVLGLSLQQAALCAGLGWLLIQVPRRTVDWPIVWLGRRLQRRAAGVPLVFGRALGESVRAGERHRARQERP